MTFPDNISHARRSLVLRTGASLLLPSALAGVARAAERWPAKTLQVVVGYPPGTSPDMLARLVQEPLAKALGTTVLVDNRAGAGGNIGVDVVAKSSDGHTIGLTGNGPLTTAKKLYPKLAYDPATDLQPISLVASTPFALVGPASAPAGTLKEFVALLKRKGDQASYGSIGVGSGGHLLMELLKSKTGLRAVHVPYRGAPAVVTAMLGGELDAGFVVPSSAMAQVKAGKIRMYGLSTASRSALVPDCPSVAQELGIPEFDLDAWNAFFGPVSMPKEHVRLVAGEVERILQRPEVRQAMFEQGWRAQPLSGTALVAKLHAESAVLNGLIQSLGITAE